MEDEVMQNRKWVKEIERGGMRSHQEGKWERVSGSPGDVQMPLVPQFSFVAKARLT